MMACLLRNEAGNCARLMIDYNTAKHFYDKLSPGQIEVMEYVAQLHTSKQIARILGVSPSAVDQRIKAAIQKLGASDRHAGARLFNEIITACERTPCASTQVDQGGERSQLFGQEFPQGPHFSLNDSYFDPTDANVDTEQTLLEILDSRLGITGRVLAIIGLAMLVAFTALAVTAMGVALNDLV